MKQADIVRQLSSNDLKRSVLYTQLLLFTLSIILSLFLFNSMTDWINLFEFNSYDILYYGVLPALFIFLFILSIIFSLFLFNSMTDWINLFDFNYYNIFYYGFLPALLLY